MSAIESLRAQLEAVPQSDDRDEILLELAELRELTNAHDRLERTIEQKWAGIEGRYATINDLLTELRK